MLSQACRRLTRDILLSCQHRCVLNEELRDVISTLGIRRRGCRAGAHCRRRAEVARRVTSSICRPSRHDGIPVINGNRTDIYSTTSRSTSSITRINTSSANSHERSRVLRAVPRLSLQHVPSSTPLLPTLPTLYVLNASAITKPHAIDHLSADFTSYQVDIAVISETHLKAKHKDQFAAVDGYAMFRRDRARRRGGGVAVYVNSRLTAALCSFITDSPRFELMWVRTKAGVRELVVGALYHPPKPLYQPTELLDHLDVCMDDIARVIPDALVILAGDFNSLHDEDITARCALNCVVNQPTRGANILDKIFVSDPSYSTVKVVTSMCKSDHKAIVAYSGSQPRICAKRKETFTFRRRSPTQHALFLDHLSHLNITLDDCNNIQENFDNLYDVMLSLLDRFYPERSITVSSADPDFITPTIKAQLRKKNRLMRAGRTEEAGALAKRRLSEPPSSDRTVLNYDTWTPDTASKMRGRKYDS